MSEADKMFEKLGYEKFENENLIEYKLKQDDGMTSIIFDKITKSFFKT